MKRRTGMALATLLLLLSCDAATLAAPLPASPAPATPGRAGVAGIGPCVLFPPNNVWNMPVDALPLDPRSADYVASIGLDTGLHPDFGAGLRNGGPIGIPYTTVPGTQLPVTVTGFSGESPRSSTAG